MNKRSSPLKENPFSATNSPSKLQKKSLIAEIMKFLKSEKIVIPPYLLKIIENQHNPESPKRKENQNPVTTREITNSSENSDLKKMKLKLNDSEFQLKKVQEDFADFKRTARIEKQKEIKKYEEQISKLKSLMDENEADHKFKAEKKIAELQKEVQSIKLKNKLELDQEIYQITKQYEDKIKAEEKVKRREISEMQRNFTKKITDMTNSHEAEVEKIKESHKKQMEEINFKYRRLIEEKQRKFDSIHTAILSEKKTEQKLHEATKLESKKQNEKLISELCYLNNVKTQLEEEIDAKDKEIRNQKNIRKDLQISILLKEERHNKKIKEIEQRNSEVLIRMNQLKFEEMQEFLKNHQKEIIKFINQIQALQKLNQEKQTITAESIKEISQLFQARQSKKEDLQEIQKLKFVVHKREEEIKKLQKDVKVCNLQLQNKEDIYNRIFKASSIYARPEKKHSLQKDEKDHFAKENDEKICRDAIFRKSQTADIKFLLKVYNQNNNKI